ncbi:hypothetical protein GOODEAATRI_029813, partial [Goodea atripinnis]
YEHLIAISQPLHKGILHFLMLVGFADLSYLFLDKIRFIASHIPCPHPSRSLSFSGIATLSLPLSCQPLARHLVRFSRTFTFLLRVRIFSASSSPLRPACLHLLCLARSYLIRSASHQARQSLALCSLHQTMLIRIVSAIQLIPFPSALSASFFSFIR